MLRILALFLATSPLWAADFHSGQAARAVFGQRSFSGADPGVSPIALSVANGRLLAIDAERRFQAFELSEIPAPAESVQSVTDKGCPVCGIAATAAGVQFSPIASPHVAISGKNLAIVDAANHRVLIWHGGATTFNARRPDIILGGSTPPGAVPASILVDPVSVAMDGKRLFVGDAAFHRVLVWNSLPVESAQPADAVLGQPDFSTIQASNGADAETVGTPTALASDGTNLFVADTLNRRILLFSPGDMAISGGAILNSASLLPGPVAPGGLITIAGQNLTDATEAAADDGIERLPRQLGGVQVILDGLALPLLSVSPSQIRAQVPYDFAGASAGSLFVRSELNDGTLKTSTAVGMKISTASPGLFAFGGPEPRDGLIVHTDGSPVTSEKPAYPGELITAWAAGLGAVAASDAEPEIGVPFEGSEANVVNAVEGLLNGRPVRVLSAALPANAIGIYEVNIELPMDAGEDSAAHLLITQNGLSSNTILLPIGKAKQ